MNRFLKLVFLKWSSLYWDVTLSVNAHTQRSFRKAHTDTQGLCIIMWPSRAPRAFGVCFEQTHFGEVRQHKLTITLETLLSETPETYNTEVINKYLAHSNSFFSKIYRLKIWRQRKHDNTVNYYVYTVLARFEQVTKMGLSETLSYHREKRPALTKWSPCSDYKK